MMRNLFVLNMVLGGHSRRATVVVVKLPGGDGAIFFYAALHFYHTSRPEIGPGKFFLPRPHYLYRPPRFLCKTRRLCCGFPAVLTTVAGTGIRSNDAHFVF